MSKQKRIQWSKIKGDDMNAAEWFARTSFHETKTAAKAAVTWDACWDSWDAEQGRWRHWARKGSQIVETDEIGVEL